MITFSSNPQMVSDKLPEIFSAFNRPIISQKQVSQKDKDTDVAVLNKKDNNIDADTQHTKPIISQPKKKLGFWKNLGAATVGYFGMNRQKFITGRFTEENPPKFALQDTSRKQSHG